MPEFMDRMTNYNSEKERNKALSKLPDVEIRNFYDIQRAIQPFLVKNDNSKQVTLTFHKKDIRTNGEPVPDIVTAKVNHYSLYRLLMEGLDMIDRHQLYVEMVDTEPLDGASEEDFGGYLPALPDDSGYSHWVDWLIQKKMGGTREGAVIVWNLNGVRYVFDPRAGTLEQDSHVGS